MTSTGCNRRTSTIAPIRSHRLPLTRSSLLAVQDGASGDARQHRVERGSMSLRTEPTGGPRVRPWNECRRPHADPRVSRPYGSGLLRRLTGSLRRRWDIGSLPWRESRLADRVATALLPDPSSGSDRRQLPSAFGPFASAEDEATIDSFNAAGPLGPSNNLAHEPRGCGEDMSGSLPLSRACILADRRARIRSHRLVWAQCTIKFQ